VADKVVDAIHDYEKQLGSHLYPLGCDDCVFFLIDEQGHIYAMDNTLDPLASSFEQALKYLLAGHLASVTRSEYETDLQAAGLLGQSWRPSSTAAV
jgi:hypothetical protein